MGSMVSCPTPRVAEVMPEPDVPLAADQVRLRTLFAGISGLSELVCTTR